MVSETHLAKRQESVRGPDLKLFVRDVADALGKKRGFVVRSWATVKDAKDAIQRITQVPVGSQRLFYGPLLTSGKELPNHRTLLDAGIYRSGETLLLDISSKEGVGGSLTSMSSLRINSNDICVSTSLLSATPKPLMGRIQHARRAFALGIKPDLVMDGSGGSYFMHDTRKNKIAVFKPSDEEPYAENNPRGYVPQAGQDQAGALREGIAPGEACIREVAAFLLDHNGFADVPMTTLAEARHPAFSTNGARLKVSEGGASIGSHSIFGSDLGSSSRKSAQGIKKVGSFQEFVRAEGSMDDISPSKLSVHEVHKIAILDIRLLNADRNSANLLVRRLPDNSLQLVPIDHGYCLRSMCDVSWMDWCWLDWPQLKEPMSEESKKYIRKLDIEADARILRERLNISEEAIDYLRASTSILKAGVEAGLTLYDIAVMCCRNDNLAEKPSMLEHLSSMASELALLAVKSEDYHHAAACQALEDQLSPKRPSTVTSRDRSSTRSFHRCASSGEFLSMAQQHDTDDDDDDGFFLMDGEDQTDLSKALDVENTAGSISKALNEAAKYSPPLSQLSGSDASSDNGNVVEKEEVDQWASGIKGIIEDSFQAEFPVGLHTRDGRSPSLSSEEGSLSSSPKGFWHVRPGFASPAAAAALSDGEDDSASLNSFGTSPEEEPSPMMSGRRQSVTFADAPPPRSFLPSGGPFFRPSTKKEAPDAAQSPNKKPADGIHSMIVSRQESTDTAASSGGMSRSKSFAALSRRSFGRSFSSTGSGEATDAPAPTPLTATKRTGSFEDHEYYRTYFHKFIDLVIVREMARQSAARAAQI